MIEAAVTRTEMSAERRLLFLQNIKNETIKQTKNKFLITIFFVMISA